MVTRPVTMRDATIRVAPADLTHSARRSYTVGHVTVHERQGYRNQLASDRAQLAGHRNQLAGDCNQLAAHSHQSFGNASLLGTP
jgi:hypothetical protein